MGGMRAFLPRVNALGACWRKQLVTNEGLFEEENAALTTFMLLNVIQISKELPL